MRFTLSVLTLFLASALAAPSSEAPENSGLLQPRCLARAQECLQPAECCSGVCAIDHGCGCQTCL